MGTQMNQTVDNLLSRYNAERVQRMQIARLAGETNGKTSGAKFKQVLMMTSAGKSEPTITSAAVDADEVDDDEAVSTVEERVELNADGKAIPLAIK